MIALPKRARPKIEAQINIVPYIDVMLVLLVIFMMTTPIIEQGIEVDLPSADANIVDFSEQQPTIITINKDGQFYINSLDENKAKITDGDLVPLGVIAGRVRARLEMYPNMKVFVRGDKEVAYGTVVLLMSFLQNNGVEKIGVVTDSPDFSN
ncbi:MAG: protein TolR [Gammaproteobacteria bacterium]|jgi:biopolymer transport protein TolR|nr:protein TolR [Gammaproteobacteria bacterium]|tara:strand:+ start:139 stop:594 length:456 start_codon:yes stop_codon:yes gene_type:complete